MPRFVLLEHDHPVRHWDFMLECGTVLRTWRLDRIPDVADEISAEPLPDHRLAYLDYEGPVRGDRGSVQRVDRGDFELIRDDEDSIEVVIRGERLQGRAIVDPQRFHWVPVDSGTE